MKKFKDPMHEGIFKVPHEVLEKHYPKPAYSKCNSGHELVEVFNDRRNRYDWDCPTCIRKMRR